MEKHCYKQLVPMAVLADWSRGEKIIAEWLASIGRGCGLGLGESICIRYGEVYATLSLVVEVLD